MPRLLSIFFELSFLFTARRLRLSARTEVSRLIRTSFEAVNYPSARRPVVELSCAISILLCNLVFLQRLVCLVTIFCASLIQCTELDSSGSKVSVLS